MEKTNLKQITQMEDILDKRVALLEQMNSLLARLEKAQEEYKQLCEYYHSEQFLTDMEQASQGQIPSEVKCGVLSEDAVYHMIGDNYDTALRMLEVATRLLKEH